jgi:hypothetical protein
MKRFVESTHVIKSYRYLISSTTMSVPTICYVWMVYSAMN